MKVLVLGGTGTVGSQVVRELLSRNVEVKVLTRSVESAAKLPQNVQPEIGNLLEPKTIRRVFQDVDGVFLLNAVSPTETHEGLMAVNGARMAGAKRIVYLSVPHLEAAPHLPHFGSKLPVEYTTKKSGIPFTILRPNNFYQNDYWFQQALVEYGVYPQPIGDVGLSRVDVRDIAEAAAIALTEPGHEGKTYHIAGAEPQTGTSTAEIWSQALGKQIAYAGNDLEEWERQTLTFLPAWMTFDFKLMYEFFQKEGLLATAEDIELQTRLLGHEPRKFEDFARETANIWKAN